MLSEELYPFADIELGDENPELTLMLSKLAKKAITWIRSNVVEPIVSHREELRSIFSIEQGIESEKYVAILAIDSTWTKPPLELVLGIMALIVTGYIVVVPRHPGFYGIRYASLRKGVSEREERFSLSVELKSKILEFTTAYDELVRHGFVDCVLIDGPLFPGFTYLEFYYPKGIADPLRYSKGCVGRELAHYVSSALVKLFDLAIELKKPIVGVVKRVSSRFLIPILKQQPLRDLEKVIRAVWLSNDKILMSYILKPGEFTIVGTVYDLIDSYAKMKNLEKLSKVIDRSCSGDLGEISRKLCEYMKETAIVYYMPKKDLVYPQAIRLDVFPRDRAREVVEYALSDTSQNSVPTPIDLVDRFVRLESSAIRRFHRLLQAYATDSETAIAIGFTNPQKAYLYSEKNIGQ